MNPLTTVDSLQRVILEIAHSYDFSFQIDFLDGLSKASKCQVIRFPFHLRAYRFLSLQLFTKPWSKVLLQDLSMYMLQQDKTECGRRHDLLCFRARKGSE